MGKHLVLVGGGHAHLSTLKALEAFSERGHRVTLISPSAYHYYSGMGPGMFSGLYRAADVRFHIRKMAEDRGASFVQGSVVNVDPKRRALKLASGEELEYDIASFNTGSLVPVESVTDGGEGVFAVKPLENLLNARRALIVLLEGGEPRLVVAGGGPAALEMTGGMAKIVEDRKAAAQITLLAGKRFLSRAPEKVRALAVESLASRGVEIVEGAYLRKLEAGQARMADGRSFPCDFSILALGIRPSALFTDSGLDTGEDGGLLVNHFLQSVRHPEIFGGGDCISLQDRRLDRVGVYAVRQNPVLQHNLLAALEGRALKPFKPQKSYLLIFNLGNRRGIFWRQNWIWSGRLAFWLKDRIDRRFMRKFQVSGEREEND